MVNVRLVRTRLECLHDSCTTRPLFNVMGAKTPLYCKRHAVDGMLDVFVTRCSHKGCSRKASWGVLTGGGATTCLYHKGDSLSGPVINFAARCKVVGCAKLSRWGLAGKQPTHCSDHAPRKDGLVRTLETVSGSRTTLSPSYGAVKSPSFQVKTECSF